MTSRNPGHWGSLAKLYESTGSSRRSRKLTCLVSQRDACDQVDAGAYAAQGEPWRAGKMDWWIQIVPGTRLVGVSQVPGWLQRQICTKFFRDNSDQNHQIMASFDEATDNWSKGKFKEPMARMCGKNSLMKAMTKGDMHIEAEGDLFLACLLVLLSLAWAIAPAHGR